MGSLEEPKIQNPWIETPLVESAALSKAAGCRIFLKLENLQPSGSFKSRGIGNLLRHSLHTNPTPHFYSSSGGNAGLACVTAASTLSRPATVVVPQSTKPFMIAKLRAAGAKDVIQHGATWREADEHLRSKILVRDENGVYVPPFDHPDIWEGNSTLISELSRQLPSGEAPDAIVCSVGGGGLFNGIMLGLDRHAWTITAVLAVETQGAASLSASLRAGYLATLDEITSLATSLAAKRVSARTFELVQRAQVKNVVLGDAEAARACYRMADDERVLVELACGASVALAYSPSLLKAHLPHLTKESKIVIVVCGGSNISLAMLEAYKRDFGPAVEKAIPVTRAEEVPSSATAPLRERDYGGMGKGIGNGGVEHVKGSEVVDLEEMMRTCEGAAGEHLPDMATMIQIAREFEET